MGDYDGGNTTGFASPAGDHLEAPIDLTELLELRRPSRFAIRVIGTALDSRAVRSGDVLVVDTSIPPCAGKVAVVMMGGETLVGTLAYRHGAWWISSGRATVGPRRIQGDDSEIWGIAVALVRADV